MGCRRIAHNLEVQEGGRGRGDGERGGERVCGGWGVEGKRKGNGLMGEGEGGGCNWLRRHYQQRCTSLSLPNSPFFKLNL